MKGSLTSSGYTLNRNTAGDGSFSRTRRFPAFLAAVLLATAAACGDSPRQPAASASSQAPPAAAGQPQAIVHGQERATVTEDQLVRQLKSMLEQQELGLRHYFAAKEMSERVGRKYGLHEVDKVAEDPELLELLAAQREAMLALQRRQPLDGLALRAVLTVLEGLAPLRVEPGRLYYVAARDEAVLAQARRAYGDAFVDWMVSREPLILETLTGTT